MFNKLLKRIKCKLSCCFQSKCSIKVNDTNDDGIPDEIKVDVRDKNKESNLANPFNMSAY